MTTNNMGGGGYTLFLNDHDTSPKGCAKIRVLGAKFKSYY